MTDNSANTARLSSLWSLLIGMVLVALVLFQFKSIASLRSEMAELKSRQVSAAAKPTRQAAARPTRSEREIEVGG